MSDNEPRTPRSTARRVELMWECFIGAGVEPESAISRQEFAKDHRYLHENRERDEERHDRVFNLATTALSTVVMGAGSFLALKFGPILILWLASLLK